MKEATGELNLTVIAVVAIAAIGALVYTFIWPTIQQSITTNTCKSAYGEDYKASSSTGTNNKKTWKCCKGNECIELESGAPTTAE